MSTTQRSSLESNSLLHGLGDCDPGFRDDIVAHRQQRCPGEAYEEESPFAETARLELCRKRECGLPFRITAARSSDGDRHADGYFLVTLPDPLMSLWTVGSPL